MVGTLFKSPACDLRFYGSNKSGSAIVYFSSISQHCYGTLHGALMTDASSFGLAMMVADYCYPRCVLSVPLSHHSFCYRSLRIELPTQSRFGFRIAHLCCLVVQFGKSSLLLLLSGMLICDVLFASSCSLGSNPVINHRLIHIICLFRACLGTHQPLPFSYGRAFSMSVCSFDVTHCSFAWHGAPRNSFGRL